MLNVTALLSWNIHEVQLAIIRNNGESIVLGVEANGLGTLFNLDLSEAQVAVPVFIYYLHKRESMQRKGVNKI